MTHEILAGANDISHLVNEIYVGVNDTAKRVLHVYAGDENGTARLVYTGSMVPPEYRQVEWIEGTGTQYINTGEKLSVNSYAMEATFSLTTNIYTGNTYLFGLFNTVRLFAMIYGQNQGSDKGKLGLGIGNGWNRTNISSTYSEKHVYKVDMKNLKAYMDGVNKSATNNSYSRGTASSTYLAIFTDGNSSGFNTSCLKGKCYGAKIWKNNEIVKDFYPCYSVSTNEAGMYDIVGKSFYSNSGTGEFIAGPECRIIL